MVERPTPVGVEAARPGEGGWHRANQLWLLGALDGLRARLEARLEGAPMTPVIGPAKVLAPAEAPGEWPALQELSALFGLSPFEEEILLLCAGVELDGAFATLCAQASGGIGPTFGLAMALAGEGAEWSALTPDGPLRRWQLVELEREGGLTGGRLRIHEAVLHFLVGVPVSEPALAGVVHLVEGDPRRMVPSQAWVADQAAALLRGGPPWPLVVLVGNPVDAKLQVAARTAALLGMGLLRVAVRALPRDPGEICRVARLLEREALLHGAALYLDAHGSTEPEGDTPLRILLDGFRGCVLVGQEVRLDPRRHGEVTLEVGRPDADEQAALWRVALSGTAPGLIGQIPRLVSHFDLDASGIGAAVLRIPPEGPGGDAEGRLARRLWDACRETARPRLDDLARRVEPRAGWGDLVLPGLQLQALRALAAQVRNRWTVHREWGFDGAGVRGLGVTALFAGPSGTGKTLAAEVVAGALGLDLYVVDLSRVVDKYIGETEKNLSRLFDAAEGAGAVLLFDEADALFGKRSEIRDSHDRYANIEVSYLLQRMESYRGLAILTTNQKGALDDAFLRRLRFVVSFPFPGPAQRADLWRRAFPSGTPTRDLDPERLARLNVAGGSVRTIALNAAFLAAEAGEPVGMDHVLAAARIEYAKLEKPLTDLGGWS